MGKFIHSPKMQRRSDKSDKTNIGCIWGLINMFNFRRGSSKLLTEKHSSSKRIGSWRSRSKMKLLTEPEKYHKDSECDLETTQPRNTVKELSTMEMSNWKESKQSVIAESDQNDPIDYPYHSNNRNNSNHNSDAHIMHIDEMTGKSICELLERISNNIAILLEELYLQGPWDQKTSKCSKGVCHHGKVPRVYSHGVCVDMKSFHDHFLLQILKALICDEITLAKHIMCEGLSSQYMELWKLLEILTADKELLLQVLKDTKLILIRDTRHQQDKSGRKIQDEISPKCPEKHDICKNNLDGSRLSEDLDIHEPFLKDRSAEITQRHDTIVILKPCPSGDKNHSSNTDPSYVLGTSLLDKERSPVPVFFHDIKRRIRQLLGESKKDQSSSSVDGESHASEQELQRSSSCGEARFMLKEPHMNNKSERTVKDSDTDTLYTSDEAIFPRKPKIDFVDLLDYGDDDKKLTYVVSRSSKNLLLLPEHSLTSSKNSSGKHEDMLMPVDHMNSSDSNQDTDVNIFRSSIINMEKSSVDDDTGQSFSWSHGLSNGQLQGFASTNGRLTSERNIPKDPVSKVVSDFSAECGQDDVYSKSDLLDKSPSHMPAVSSHDDQAVESTGVKSGKSSPVSVLEPMFVEKFVSLGSLSTKRAKDALSPRRIDFKDSNFSESGRRLAISLDAQVKTCVNNNSFKYEYMRSLLDASGICNCNICELAKSPDQLLNLVLYDEVETPSEEIPDDLRIFFDSLNEVLVEIYEKSSSQMPWVSFYKPSALPFPTGENLMKEAWRLLNYVFVPCSATTLDEIVDKDLEIRQWMDIRAGAEETGFDFSDEIMESLLEETIFELKELFYFYQDSIL